MWASLKPCFSSSAFNSRSSSWASPTESVYQHRQVIIIIIHTHPFNGPFSRTTQVSRYQKRKTNLDFTEERDSEWQWHQLEHMQVCTSLQTDNHANTLPLSVKALKAKTINSQYTKIHHQCTLLSNTCRYSHWKMISTMPKLLYAQKFHQTKKILFIFLYLHCTLTPLKFPTVKLQPFL